MSPDSRFVPASPNYTVVRKRNPLQDGLPRMKWRARVKTDFFLARPAYGVKTTGQAVQVLLSPFWSVPDLVNPRFILGGDHLYVKPVENLVLAIRGLSSKNYKEAQQALRRIPLFNTIVQVLREWDVVAMNREMTLLQREPRGRTFADFGPLLVPVLKPLYRLVRLNLHVHLLPAVAKMYELARMHLKDDDERKLLLRYYSIAREELPLVFTQLRQRLYPVLLKLLSDRFIDPDQFFLETEGSILAFLGLKEEDLVRDMPEPVSRVMGDPTAKAAPGSETAVVPKLALRGFELLDQLFPRAGWKTLAENPDLYSYFQTLFDFPKGSDLIPVDDAIQVVQPLSEILQNLFYGFQNIQWGTAVNQAGEVVRIQEELDKAVARWHFFHEEFFGKNYLPLLQEYCREVERAGPVSNDAKRREHQLLWFKRNYLLPHLVLPIMDDVRPKSLGYPNLAIQVRDMLDLLSPVAVDLERQGATSTVLKNPETKVRFPVTNMVSQRFQSSLKRTVVNALGERHLVDQSHNRALLFHTLALLSSLDWLLSKAGSLLYTRTPKYLYRTSGLPGDDKPVYNAPKKNSLVLLKKINDQPPADLETKPWQTQVGDLYGPVLAAEDIKARIQENHVDKKPFVLVSFRIWPDDQASEFPVWAGELLDQGTSLQPQDDGSWFHVMRDTLEEEAEDFARKILAAAAGRTPPQALGALVVPFFTNWNLEKLVTIAARGWPSLEEIPPQVLGVWVNSAQAFEFRTDVPTVPLEDPPEETPPSPSL